MARIRTPICERLGIEHPVFQAGMGWVARADLAAAVSEAGGLGVVGAGSTMDGEQLRAEIRRVRELTDKPFGVDILFATVRAEGEQRRSLHRHGAGHGRGRAGGAGAGAGLRPRQPGGGRAGGP